MMQLVIITREDPQFPLAKMRSMKRLLELRISQLRFTEEEVKTYFSQQLHISLKEEQTQQLINRTEGWIAGLQMIMLSMQGIDNVDGFIEAFSNSQYYIMDYLMEEVLERQTPEIKAFLLKTSILESFCGDLCDAVMQLEAGSSNIIIERLAKTNCFIISTELSHKWFRYHHLFRDLLRHRLEQQSKSIVETFHVKAGLWFKTNGYGHEAIHHYINANEYEEAMEYFDISITAWLDGFAGNTRNENINKEQSTGWEVLH
jgi:LuxR family maltose regulon positive regulatory protein